MDAKPEQRGGLKTEGGPAMAEVGGMLASAVLNVVFKQISALIGAQITLQQDFAQDLKKMKMTLESLTAVLKDAERKSIEDISVQLWLKRLKNAMYDISDMLDEFEADTTSAVPKMSLKKGLLQIASIGPKTKLANRMQKMREELNEITDQQVRFRLETGSDAIEQKFSDARETTMFMNNEEPIVGRTEEGMKIMDSLSKNITQKLVIFPIYGIGGIGKTTMAKMVFNDTKFKDYSRVWVYVSQMFDLKKIGNSIISQVSKMESQITDMQMIHTHLAELLAGKNILIILDDLWEDNDQFQLDELKKMLKVSEDIHKIIVIITTRNEIVANDLYTIQPYKLSLLSDDSCWSIIKQKCDLDSRPDKKQLEQIGKDIARKCGGVALAAKVIGHMLRTFTSDEWESVRKSNIWNLSTSQETHSVLSSLRLTYTYMTSPLRLCFAYCAIFPKGHNIVKDDLIHQWISLGFIETTHVLTTRQLSEKYITQLIGLSFLEHSANGMHHKEVKHLTMHDLVHDLAQLVLADELILGVNRLGNNDASRCRYALFDDCSKKLESYTDSPAMIRAMRFLDCGKIRLHGDVFSSAKYLRVLDLSECFIQELPDSVGQLKQLRYLNAPKIQHWIIPNCITKLLKLRYLNLRGSSALLELPDSVRDLEDLIHLDLSGCSGLEKLPQTFGQLKKLVHLDLSNCTNVTGVSEAFLSLTNLEFLDISYCWNIRELPEHLGSLLKLKYLNMSGCDEIELPGSFGNLKNLVHLDLSHCCQIIVTPDVFGGLTKLHHLNLSHCGCIGGTKVAEAMSNLTELRYLHLSGFMDTMCHGESAMSTSLEYISTLSNLEHLDLSCNIRLSHLPECITSLGKLHTLDLSDCSSLQSVPETIIQMHSLKLAYVKDCGLYQRLWDIKFKVHGDAIKGGSNVALLRALNVTKLKVYGLEEMKSIEGMESIKLIGEQGIDELTFAWSRDARPVIRKPAKKLSFCGFPSLVWSSRYHGRVVDDHEVLRGLEPASTVKSLDIESYNSVLFPDWLMGIPAYNFPYLRSISLVDLANCISLPPLGQLPNLKELVLRKMRSVAKIDEDFCGGAVAFLQLKRFILDNMESLEVWNTTYSSGGYMFPSLDELRVYDCPKLRLKPCLPKVEHWVIRGSDGLISSWEESMSETGASTSSSPLVIRLTIKGCKLPMHQWALLHHLPALRVLCIEDEQNNEDSRLYLGDLMASNMKRIKIYRHNYRMGIDLMGTPVYNFLDLVRVYLEDLDNCISLPPLGQLPNLRRLYLRGMQSIEKIEEDFCGGAGAIPGLENFTLYDMPNLNVWNTTYSCSGDVVSGYMFPNLRELLIHGCPKLRLKPCPPKAEEWTIEESDGVISMWGESTSDTGASTSSSPLVTKLTIQGCKLPMHQWRLLHHLPTLPELCIKDCSDLASSPEINRAPLLDWLGHLTSLKKLDISGCKNIESLPESIQLLTKLEKLVIYRCPLLQRWCKTEENQMKLAHIKFKIVFG